MTKKDQRLREWMTRIADYKASAQDPLLGCQRLLALLPKTGTGDVSVAYRQ